VIRCVAFDLDGVVIPSGPSFDLFEARYEISRAQFADFFSGPYQAAMRGDADLHDVLPATLEAWGWPGTLEDFCDVWMNSCGDCDPAVETRIGWLRAAQIDTCAATNQDNRRAAFLDSLPALQRLFARRFFSCRIGFVKPRAEYFLHIEAELGLAPEELLFLDDRIENVQGARACGWRAEQCRGADEVGSALQGHIGKLPLR
jgi:putative hydrolase of the HAD superfamily